MREADLDAFSPRVRENLILGMKLFYLLEPVYKVNKDMDASCCAILFCKAIELYMTDCFREGLKRKLPHFKVKGQGRRREEIALKDVNDKELTLGSYSYIIRNNISQLERIMQMMNESKYNSGWWKKFADTVDDCAKRRNDCCHSGSFKWSNQNYLLADIFTGEKGKNDTSQNIDAVRGLLYEAKIGKRLADEYSCVKKP